MGNDHGHNHNHHAHSGSKNILIAFLLNFTFAIVEFIGGLYTNSMAILSDSLHDFGDSMALLLSYFMEKYSKKDPDAKYTFGYKRFSVLSAMINGLILFLGSLFVIKEAFERVFNPSEIHQEGMLILAILGIVVNSIAAWRLSKDEGLNQKMVMLHLLEDILGWVAVFIVSIVLFFKPWFVLDSILSILISILILKNVYKNLLETFKILLQKFPNDLELDSMEKEIKSLRDVIDIHCIQGWSLDSSSFALNLHVVAKDQSTIKEIDSIKRDIKEILKKYDVEQSSIEFESQSYHCDHSLKK
ncbi:cation diffusion facilitator family transporter [Halobacteriovorax sp. GB3]|uniref:cation diffusion facilitator family transporter n=1 Tax=Halobacteriovorax sp. GB3 TaxID=2719615 RepID=UPI00235EC952|nr:cation diffusion facilitator family transporter [Halobacteriovorax sp. GB3]MDD0853475.1 cation diffusion facilitator family transporter [Halobacteriovorax sp. GB3]